MEVGGTAASVGEAATIPKDLAAWDRSKPLNESFTAAEFAAVAAKSEDDEVVRTRFRKQDGQGYANWDDYLGLEHAQVQGGRKKAAIKSHYDKPIKING